MEPDPDRTDAFGRRLLDLLTGNVLTMLIGVGHPTGLLEAATRGPAAGVEPAERAGLHERFHDLQVLDSPRPQNCIYVCRPGPS